MVSTFLSLTASAYFNSNSFKLKDRGVALQVVTEWEGESNAYKGREAQKRAS